MTLQVIALATDLTFHVAAQTETSTTKDSTDTDDSWDENDVTGISYDIQIGALTGADDSSLNPEQANMLNDIINGVSDNTLAWELAVVNGVQNRTIVEKIASGMGKLTNVNPTGTNRQAATYSATLNGFGPYFVEE